MVDLPMKGSANNAMPMVETKMPLLFTASSFLKEIFKSNFLMTS